MNNRGYTLVEILAVVAILGILSGVAIMGVSRYLTKSREQAYDNIAESSYDATVNYIMEKNISVNQGGTEVLLSELVDLGYLDTPIDPKTKKAECSCSKNDSCKSYVKVTTLPNSDSLTLDEYKYEVNITCLSGYKKQVIFPKK